MLLKAVWYFLLMYNIYLLCKVNVSDTDVRSAYQPFHSEYFLPKFIFGGKIDHVTKNKFQRSGIRANTIFPTEFNGVFFIQLAAGAHCRVFK